MRERRAKQSGRTLWRRCATPGLWPGGDSPWTEQSSFTRGHSDWLSRTGSARVRWTSSGTTTSHSSMQTKPSKPTARRLHCWNPIQNWPRGGARIAAKAAGMITEKSGAFRIQPDPDMADHMIDMGLESEAEPATRAWLLAARGRCAIYRQELKAVDPVPIEDRIGSLRTALEMADTVSAPGLLAFAATALSDLYVVQGSYELALDISRMQLDLLDPRAPPSERAMVFFESGAALNDLAGRHEEALELGLASYEIAKDRSLHELMHATYLASTPCTSSGDVSGDGGNGALHRGGMACTRG